MLSRKQRTADVLAAIVFYSLLATMLFAAVPYGTVDPWWIALWECFVFGITILWIIEGALSTSWFVKTHTMVFPIVGIWVLGVCQLFPNLRQDRFGISDLREALSLDPYGTRLVLFKLTAYALTLLMLLRYTDSRKRLQVLVHTVIALVATTAVFGISRQIFQTDAAFILPRLAPRIGYGQFINYNHFALFMEMGLGLAAGLILGRGVANKLIYLIAALPIWIALILSNSRGGIFSMFCQVTFIAMWVIRPRNKTLRFDGQRRASVWRMLSIRSLTVAALLVAVIIGTMWIGGSRLIERIETDGEISRERQMGQDSVRRVEIWKSTWQLIVGHPVAGVGLGAYWVGIDEHNNRSGKLKPYAAHNDYLDLLASGGVLGLMLGAWLLTDVTIRARREARSSDGFRAGSALGGLTALLGVAVHSLFDFGLQITSNALVFIALIVIATTRLQELSGTSPSPVLRILLRQDDVRHG